jgi:hypothetical protein
MRPPKDACDLSDTRSRAGIAHQNPDSSGPNPATEASPPNRERGNPKGVCQGRPESGHTPDMLGSGTFAKDAQRRRIFG